MSGGHQDFNILNLETIVKAWAKQMYEVNSKKPKFEELMLRINWDGVSFNKQPIIYSELQKVQASDVPTCNVLFKTKFANESNREQQYSFHVERNTTSVMEIQLQTGYSLGVKMEVGIKLPAEIFSMSTGFEYNYSLSRTQTQSNTETITWGADSTISVPEGQRAVAELAVEQNQLENTFKVNTEANGTVEVVLTNPRDNNSFVTQMEGNIATIFKSQRHAYSKDVAYVEDNVLHIKTEGKTLFSFASEQKIRVSYEPI